MKDCYHNESSQSTSTPTHMTLSEIKGRTAIKAARRTKENKKSGLKNWDEEITWSGIRSVVNISTKKILLT